MHDRNNHYIGCAHRKQRRLILETGGVHDCHVMDFALSQSVLNDQIVVDLGGAIERRPLVAVGMPRGQRPVAVGINDGSV